MNNQKFTIAAVQQTKLLELNLDIKDAFILTYLRDLIGGSNKMVSKVVDEEVYYWVKYENICKYLPILKIENVKVISRRIANYDKLGLVKRHTHRPYSNQRNSFQGSFTFLSLTQKFSELFESSKIQIDQEELEESARIMGLTLSEKTPHREHSKVPSTEGTQKFLHSRYSKVPSIEGTQKFFHNTPNNNTPNNNTTTTSNSNKVIELSSNIQKNSSSRREYIFLKKYKISTGTMNNINRLIEDLTEDKFKTIFEKTTKAYESKEIQNFEAVLFKALKGEWTFNIQEEKKESPEQLRKKVCNLANHWISHETMGLSCSEIFEKFTYEARTFATKELIEEYQQKIIKYFKK